jgi:hypothetical protein
LQSRIDHLADNADHQSARWQRAIAKAQADFEALRDNKPPSIVKNIPDLTGIFICQLNNNFGENP